MGRRNPASEHIPLLLRRAFQDCRTAPAGPVFLSLPINVMESGTFMDAGQPSRIELACVASGLEELAEALTEVAPGHLAVIVGEEVFAANAGAEVVSLAEALGTPVFGASWPGHIPFPTANPYWQGTLPPKASAIREQLAPFSAVSLLAGHSLISYPYSEGPAIPRQCRLLQLTSDGHQIGRIHEVALGLVGDIGLSLQALLPLIRSQTDDTEAVTKLQEQAKVARECRRGQVIARTLAEFDAPVMTPFVAASQVLRAIGPNIPIVDEAPATLQHVRMCLDSLSDRQYLFTRSAILGWGMPTAIGTSLGLSRCPVVCLVGDGSAMYSPQALWTAAHLRLPVTFVVMNNSEYNILKNYARAQPHYHSARTNRFIGMDMTDPSVDFVALASTYGLPTRRVKNARDIEAAIQEGIHSGRANLIELIVHNE